MLQDSQIIFDCERISNNLFIEGVRYVSANRDIKTLVLGMSGGVDSTVTAAIAQKVCQATGVKLHGHVMPIITNTPEETARGIFAAGHLCDEHFVYDFSGAFIKLLEHIDSPLYRKVQQELKLTLDDKIRLGNIKARIRMIHLYNQARKHNGLVLSTDNLTEYMLGFWTLHGDVGDFGLLQNLWKTEVYGLANHLGRDCAEAAAAKPTDGLGVSNSDLEQLLPGWYDDGQYQTAYRYVDDILIDYVDNLGVYSESHPVVQRVKATGFKRENPISVRRSMALWDKNTPVVEFKACL